MSSFRVWLGPIDDFCRVRVEGFANARWLLVRLSESFIFKTFDSDFVDDGGKFVSFLVPLNPPLSQRALARILSAIPEVTLLSEKL